jgi:protein-L-isoaspartate(D-aspartate) O-methyltransferase
MLDIPREAFVPAGLVPLAYLDRDVPVSADGRSRALMQPMILSKLIQAAEIGPSDVVLEVGTGTGYGAAVAARLASSVVALEEDGDLADRAASTLSRLGVDNVTVVRGRLADGHPGEAPYDVILLAGSVEVVPDALVRQLKDGGRLVVVENSGPVGRGVVYTRTGDDVAGRVVMNASIPPLPGFSREPAFVF